MRSTLSKAGLLFLVIAMAMAWQAVTGSSQPERCRSASAGNPARRAAEQFDSKR